MRYLLDLVYLALLAVVWPLFVWKAFTTGKYRQGFGAKCFGRVPRRDSDRPCFWLHAVSVGEVNLLGRLIDEIARRRPDVECVVSTTTRTGMELAKKKYADHIVFYCPFDFSWAVRRAMRRIRPEKLLLAELEIWPNLISATKASGAQVAVFNGRLSENSFRGYRRIRPLVSAVLRKIDLIAAQNETYAERFRLLGARESSVCVTGSMKYDGAQTDRNHPKAVELRQLAGLTDQEIVFLAGSTQDPEEAAAVDAFRHLADRWSELRLILVPRHPERFDAVGRLLDESGLSWRRRSRLEADGPLTSETRILLVDTIGELGAWWASAEIAFVGGSFGSRGGQNMIEPAAYGAAVSFGPNTWNFRDIVTGMLADDAAVVVDDAAAMERFVRRCLEEPGYAERLGQRARRLVQGQLGATARTVDLLAE